MYTQLVQHAQHAQHVKSAQHLFHQPAKPVASISAPLVNSSSLFLHDPWQRFGAIHARGCTERLALSLESPQPFPAQRLLWAHRRENLCERF